MPCHEYCEECLGPDKEDCAFCPASLKLIWDSGNHDEPGSMGIKGYGMYVDKPGLKIKGIIGKDDDDMMDMCKMDGFNKKDFEDKGIDFEEAEDDYDFEGPDKEDYEDDDKEDDDKEDYDKEDYDKEDDDKEDDEDDEEERKENNKAKVQEQKDGFGLILGACGCAHDQFVTTTLGCQLCHFSCDGCTGPSNDDCIECADLYEMNADK